MQRYFINEKIENTKQIQMGIEDHHHIKKVMRYKDGEQIICIDTAGNNYLCHIEDVDRGLVSVDQPFMHDSELDIDVTLIYALPKGDKFELVLQKATELGVKHIVPFLSNRCVIKTNKEKFSKKKERYQKILKEASEQSGRNYIPILHDVIDLAKIGEYLGTFSLVGYEETAKAGKHGELAAILQQVKPGDSITIIVGSEGGFDQEEIVYMNQLGIHSCSLGKRILRSETAPLYMLSVIGYSREVAK